MDPGTVSARSISAVLRGLTIISCLLLLITCSHHRPAPVEEHSAVPLKRHLNKDGSYTVQAGDTLYAIAFNYGMDPESLARWNRISSPYVIYPGQNLRFSAPRADTRTGGSSSVNTRAVANPGQATTKKAGDTSRPPQSAASAGNRSPVVPASAETGPVNWQWPTNGRILRNYVADDPARNGLDIAGREGQAVTAAASGQVVYSGSGLIGYGELIIIKHNEKMLSAYAHNRIRLVKEGERVVAGQKIAELGRNSGNEEILHFEIRSHGKPVNPLGYLPKKNN